MADHFRGQFEIKMDSKGRMVVPSPVRETLDGNAVLTNAVYMGSHCLDVYSSNSWNALEQRISKLNPLKTEVQSFQRFYLSAAQDVELDGQQRILIPPTLRNFANLEGGVVLVGMGSKFEIWSAKEWKKLQASLAKSFEKTLADIAELED